MVAIGNPIRGLLHDNAWQRPVGNTDMRVTQTAAQHIARGGPPALDIGDGDPDLDDILSPHSGTVAQALTAGSANLSIDFPSGGKRWRVVLAHNTLPHPVAVNQTVSESQVVGRMGKTGATAIHLHIQLGWLNGSTWLWVDPWPYLRQNGATEDEVISAPILERLSNKRGAIPSNAKFRADPSTSHPELRIIPAGSTFDPDFAVTGAAVVGSTRWLTGMSEVAGKQTRGYLHESVVGPLQPIESVGYSDADLNAAKKVAANIVSAAASTAASKF